MAREEDLWHCLHIQLIDTLSRTGVRQYINQEWDYVITVCGNANETCPIFAGKVKHRLHIGFDDPAVATGSDEHIKNEFRRIRDEIKERLQEFYIQQRDSM